MNRDNININSTAGDRRTYLSPCVQIIKMETTNPLAESLEIPVDGSDATDANGKQWQGDFDLSDEEVGNYEKEEWGSVW